MTASGLSIGVPSRRGFAALALAASSAFFSPSLAVALGLAVAGLAALDRLLARRADRLGHALDLTLDVPRVLPQKATGVATLHAVNRGPSEAIVRCVLDLSTALAGAGAEAVRTLVLPPRSRATAVFPLQARERGVVRLTTLHVRELGPLRLFWCQRRVALDTTVEVRPFAAAGKDAATKSARLQRIGMHSVRARGDRGEFESLRSYVRGDDPRRLDWKATAKRRALTVRRYQDERSQSVMLVIDAGRLMIDRIDGMSRLDWAVAAAGALAAAARAWSDSIGVMVFADEVQAFLPPGNHPADRITQLLTRATARRVEPNYPRALVTLARSLKRRSLVVLLGEVIDREVSAPVAAHLAQLAGRHLPLFVALRHPELQAQSIAPAVDPASLMRRVAATELLLARQKALEAMKQNGIQVVDALPSASLDALVERYLRIKRGGAL